MLRRGRLQLPLLIALVTGCAGSPTSENAGEVFMAVSGPVVAGGTAAARLVNNSDATLEFGMLSCEVRTDRQASSGWVEVPRESGFCPIPSSTVPPGIRYWFRFAAPKETGTFRLRAGIGTETVTSEAFVVR